MPKVETIVNPIRKSQFISKFPTSPINPINDFRAIINNEVATAFFMGSFTNKTKVGMIKKPPPIPTTPVNKPIRMPCNIIKG